LLLVLAFATYLSIFLLLIPANGHAMGGDYALHMPNMIAGYYWFLKNGAFAIPWFNPGECGGIPFIADFNVGYYTFPQWASFILGPLAALRLTFAVFAAIGAIGFFVLMRGPFRVSQWAALSSAVLFLFSGFYPYRMAVGHITFHAFTLVPWLAWAGLAVQPGAQPSLRASCLSAISVVGGGLIIAYMIHSGMVHAIPVGILAVAVMFLIHGQLWGHRWQPWLILGGSIVVGIAFSAQRLAAAVAFFSYFPRDIYPLAGFRSLFDTVQIAFRSVFWHTPTETARSALVNYPFWPFGRHEWEYGIGPVALLLLVPGAAASLWQAWRNGGFAPRRLARAIPVGIAVAFALVIPLLLNWYQPHWNAILKALPYFGSSSTLIRWFALYPLLVTLLSGLAFDRVIPQGMLGAVGAGVIVASTITWNLLTDRTYYRNQSYDGSPIEQAWRAARSPSQVPVVRDMIVGDRANPLLDRNNAIILGHSQVACYQPVFGYRLETMMFGPIRTGPALANVADDVLNVKNPACYLFPRENSCRAGDHFRTDQLEAAQHFLRYEPFAFQISSVQRIADFVTYCSVLLAGLLLVAAIAIVIGARAGK